MASYNPYSSQTWRRGLSYGYQFIETGYPRNLAYLRTSGFDRTATTKARTVTFFQDDFDRFGYDPDQDIAELLIMEPLVEKTVEPVVKKRSMGLQMPKVTGTDPG